ncbi:nucleoside triphosphate pyrophosphohydrolase [Planobacterium oryzisoli]|uniref:Nucleoside triphosphate pyrophosphohydrolase n=1 Tax=Planobacterium oryzisoli TaxID=2771435 RepID=A0A930YV79_9FLAO|nr:nucleoside triphosphate pyrophosphohydrolase [Planobacterium oryzisoli]MBF5026998.1 nucleoside triphosphate pyrophosphohydrolase [Planobacterium oryzisoli]
MTTRQEQLEAFSKLLDIMDTLRAECPWDKKQTLASLRPLTLEEVYELSDALIKEDMEEISKELGDVLLHLVFYAKIGAEKGSFDIGEVINRLCEKLIFRHPHIYGEKRDLSELEVKENWEKLKLKEGNKSVLGGVSKAAPSLVKAYRIQEKVRGVGFEFASSKDAWEKVEEELQEFKEESDPSKKEMELGDVLFSLTNYARLEGLNPDTALERSNAKFIKRFQAMEHLAKERELTLSELTLPELDGLWEEVKKS